ncbi:MAG TPA: nitrate ABC transporter substrate-binding protein, partial [Negativicutes bacterium]|nr:nitrate ABC transporter substrate-binding protein [Negativicutes bacterium]
NKEDAYRIWTKAGISIESAKYINESDALFAVKIDEQSVKKLNDIKKFLLEEKLIQNDFDVAKWVDESFYEQAIK